MLAYRHTIIGMATGADDIESVKIADFYLYTHNAYMVVTFGSAFYWWRTIFLVRTEIYPDEG